MTNQETVKRRFKVEDLDTGVVREYQLGNSLRPVTLLSVPYVSQLSPDADAHSNDCGAASAVMLLKAYQKASLTPNEFYTQFNITGDPFLSVSQIQKAMTKFGLPTDYRAGMTIPDLFNLVATGKPAIVLIRYKVLFEAGLTEKSFQGPHFAIVVGLDPKYVYIHDPLYTDPLAGEAHPYPLEKFWQAWKEVALDPSFRNPERSAIIPTMGIGFQVNRMVKVNTPSLNVRSGPGLNMSSVGTVKKGDLLAVSREINGWGEIGTNKWIKLSYTVEA
jgi:predicted double-glycine peptidase